MRRLIAALLVVAIPVLAAAPLRAEERPPLRIVIPAHLLAMTDAQTPSPKPALPKQTDRNFLAVVVVVSALAILAVVITAKYGD